MVSCRTIFSLQKYTHQVYHHAEGRMYLLLCSSKNRGLEFPSWNFQFPTSKRSRYMTPKLTKILADRDKMMSLWQFYTQVNFPSIYKWNSGEKTTLGKRHHHTFYFTALANRNIPCTSLMQIMSSVKTLHHGCCRCCVTSDNCSRMK